MHRKSSKGNVIPSPFILRLIEASPLGAFLIYARLIDQSVSTAWLGPYLSASVLSVLTTGWLIYVSAPINRLFIGINLYLVSGAVGLLFGLNWLNQLYAQLQAAGMLAWIVLVGVVTILFSDKGFIDVEYRTRKKAVIISLSLLLGAVMAFLMSFTFSSVSGSAVSATSWFLAELAPFVFLFSLQGFLKSKFPS